MSDSPELTWMMLEKRAKEGVILNTDERYSET